MNFKTLFDLDLSNSTDGSRKTVKIIQGEGTLKKNGLESKIKFNRMEIRHVNHTNISYGVTFDKNDMAWFLRILEQKLDDEIHDKKVSLHFGKKTFIYNDLIDCNPQDETIAISSCDANRVYGILLDIHEQKMLLKNKSLLNFLFTNQNVSGEILKNITIGLFISIIGNFVKEIIQREFSIKPYFKNYEIFDKIRFIELALSDGKLDAIFLEKFHQLMTLLNVTSTEKVIQTQVTIPEIKKAKMLLIEQVGKYLDVKEGISNDIGKLFDLIKCEKPEDVGIIASTSSIAAAA